MSEPTLRTVPLDTPIVRGETTITEIQIRKPASGELRGLSLVELTQLNVNAVSTLLPRITVPTLTPQDVAGMDPADLLACGAELADFLLQKRAKPDSLAS